MSGELTLNAGTLRLQAGVLEASYQYKVSGFLQRIDD